MNSLCLVPYFIAVRDDFRRCWVDRDGRIIIHDIESKLLDIELIDLGYVSLEGYGQ